MSSNLSEVTKENEGIAEEMILAAARASRNENRTVMFSGKEAFDFLVCQGAEVKTKVELCGDEVRASDAVDLVVAGYRLHCWQNLRKATDPEIEEFTARLRKGARP